MRRGPRLALLLLAVASAAPAQDIAGYRIRVTYDGITGPHVKPDGTCPGATPHPGAIVVEGNVYGDESTIEDEGVASYMGCLDSETDIDVCDVSKRGGGDNYCVTGVRGTAKVKVLLEINSDRAGAYIQMTPVPGTVNLTAGGTCSSDLTNEIKQLHSTEAEVAEIPTVPAGKLRFGQRYRSGPGDQNWMLEVLPDRDADPLAYPGGPNDPCPGQVVPHPTGPDSEAGDSEDEGAEEEDPP